MKSVRPTDRFSRFTLFPRSNWFSYCLKTSKPIKSWVAEGFISSSVTLPPDPQKARICLKHRDKRQEAQSYQHPVGGALDPLTMHLLIPAIDAEAIRETLIEQIHLHQSTCVVYLMYARSYRLLDVHLGSIPKVCLPSITRASHFLSKWSDGNQFFVSQRRKFN